MAHPRSNFQRSMVHILLSDKDVFARQEVHEMLRRCSYRVTAVENTRQILRFLKSKGPSVDIVLADVDAQDRKDFKILKRIMDEETYQSIAIITMSRHDEVPLVVRCLRLGALDFLVKPLRTNELLNLWTHMWRRRKMLGLTMRQGIGLSDMSDSLLSACTDTGNSNTGSLDARSDGQFGAKDCAEAAVDLGRRNGNGHIKMEGSPSAEDLKTIMSPRLQLSLKPAAHVIRPTGLKQQVRNPFRLWTCSATSAFNQYSVPTQQQPSHCARLRGGDASELPPQPALQLVTPSKPVTNSPPETTRHSRQRHCAGPPSTSYESRRAQTPQQREKQRPIWLPPKEVPRRQEIPPLDLLPRDVNLLPPAPFPLVVTSSLPLPGLPSALLAAGTHPLLAGGLPPLLHPAGFALPPHMPLFGLPDSLHSDALHMPPPMARPPSGLLAPFPPFFPGFGPPPMLPPAVTKAVAQVTAPGILSSAPQAPQGAWSKPQPNVHANKNERKVEAAERRGAALTKFRQKRKDRCFEKKIRYVSRKKLAESRPRIKGQFVRRTSVANGEGDEEEEFEEEEDEEEDYSPDGDSSAQAVDSSPEMYNQQEVLTEEQESIACCC